MPFDGDRPGVAPGARRDRLRRAVRGQLAAAQPRRLGQRGDRASCPSRGSTCSRVDRPGRPDGLGGAHARRPLGAVALLRRGADRAAARDRALPALDAPRDAGDAPRADRSADRARQPPALPRAPPARAARRAGARHAALARACSTSTTSRRSTTASATPSATACSRNSRRACARAARASGSAATSSPSSSPARRSTTRSSRPRRSSSGSRPRRSTRRRDDRQRRRRHLPVAGRRPRRADPARRQRALLGEGARARTRSASTGRTWSSSPSSSGSRAAPTRPRATAPRLARQGRRRARRLHRQPLGARRPTSPHEIAVRLGPERGARRADPARRAASTTSASSRSRRRSCASRARSPRPSGSCSSAIRRSATGCSRASASTRSPTGCSTTTSAGTAPATRTALAGEAIPLGARIIFVADAYDAMTSDRVYRPRLTDEEAVAELRAAPGPSSTRRIVAAFAEELGYSGRTSAPSSPQVPQTLACSSSTDRVGGGSCPTSSPRRQVNVEPARPLDPRPVSGRRP